MSIIPAPHRPIIDRRGPAGGTHATERADGGSGGVRPDGELAGCSLRVGAGAGNAPTRGSTRPHTDGHEALDLGIDPVPSGGSTRTELARLSAVRTVRERDRRPSLTDRG